MEGNLTPLIGQVPAWYEATASAAGITRLANTTDIVAVVDCTFVAASEIP